MKSIFLTLLILALIGCKSEKDEPVTPSRQFGGKPYTGRLIVNIEPHQGNSTRHVGNGSLHFVDNGSISTLVLYGVIDNSEGEAGDAGFVLDGSIKDSNWKFEQQGMQFEINKDGVVSGTNTTPTEEYTFDGNLSETKFQMEVVAKMLEETEGGYPAGSIFRYNYDFWRVDPNPGQADEEACKNIRWELRNIWNPGGNGMMMVRVPVCND